MRFFFLRLLTLVAAIGLTLRAQAFWMTDDPFEMFFSCILWLPLIGDWIVRQVLQIQRGRQIERRQWLLPFCLLLVTVCGVTHIPLRVLFWTQKAALEAAEKQPPIKLTIADSPGAFQIARSHGDTRFLLWEAGGAFGFTHCPNDSECEQAKFRDYWDYSEGVPKYVHAKKNNPWNYNSAHVTQWRVVGRKNARDRG